MLPPVEKVAVPEAGAVQVYQTEEPEGAPSIVSGSPDSIVALMLLPKVIPFAPESEIALVKESFAGCAKAEIPANVSKEVSASAAERGAWCLMRET